MISKSSVVSGTTVFADCGALAFVVPENLVTVIHPVIGVGIPMTIVTGCHVPAVGFSFDAVALALTAISEHAERVVGFELLIVHAHVSKHGPRCVELVGATASCCEYRVVHHTFHSSSSPSNCDYGCWSSLLLSSCASLGYLGNLPIHDGHSSSSFVSHFPSRLVSTLTFSLTSRDLSTSDSICESVFILPVI